MTYGSYCQCCFLGWLTPFASETGSSADLTRDSPCGPLHLSPFSEFDTASTNHGFPNDSGSAYLQSMDFQREPQSKYHLYFLDCFFFTSWPTRPISLTLTQTPTPADRVVSIHSWRPLGHSTVWADFVRVSGSVLYLVRTQSKK